MLAGVFVAGITKSDPNNFSNPIILILTITAACLFFCLVLAVSILTQAAIIIALSDSQENSARSTIRKAKSKAIPYFITSSIASLIAISWSLIFIIPGIIISIWLLTASYVSVLENKSGIDALAKSREYARGYFWSIFLLCLIGAIAFIFLDSILKTLNSVPLLGAFFYAAASLMIAPFPPIYFYLIYEKLKERNTCQETTKKQRLVWIIIIAISIAILLAAAGLTYNYRAQIKNLFDQQIEIYNAQQNSMNRQPR